MSESRKIDGVIVLSQLLLWTFTRPLWVIFDRRHVQIISLAGRPGPSPRYLGVTAEIATHGRQRRTNSTAVDSDEGVTPALSTRQPSPRLLLLFPTHPCGAAMDAASAIRERRRTVPLPRQVPKCLSPRANGVYAPILPCHLPLDPSHPSAYSTNI